MQMHMSPFTAMLKSIRQYEACKAVPAWRKLAGDIMFKHLHNLCLLFLFLQQVQEGTAW